MRPNTGLRKRSNAFPKVPGISHNNHSFKADGEPHIHYLTRAAILVLVLSCGSATDPTLGPYGYYCPPQSSSDAFPTSHPSFPSDSSGDLLSDWAWLATHTPGCWAGAYVESVRGSSSSYNLVVALVDTGQLPAAIDSIRVYQPSLLTGIPGVVSIRSQ